MEKFVFKEDEGNNRLFGDLYLGNSVIKFKGCNNILFIDGKVNLIDSSIEFRGDNSIIYICHTDDTIQVDIKVYNDSTVYFGKDIWINKGIKIVASEQTNVFFGNECLISYDTCIRTGDPHLIYDCSSHERINKSKSFYAGDHVWIGQHVMMLKGIEIGSGSVIGAMSLVSGKKYSSNCVYGGNPAKKIKSNIFFLRDDCHRFTEKETEECSIHSGDEFIYQKDKNTLPFDEIEDKLKKSNVEDRLEYLNSLTTNNNKNRFFIE